MLEERLNYLSILIVENDTKLLFYKEVIKVYATLKRKKYYGGVQEN